MNKKYLFVSLFFLLIFSSLLLVSFKKKSPERPNIIFLLADDLRYDALSCMGNTILKTPNIDALAKGGTLFKNSFATTPICCVSRASIFSGQYSNRHGINDFGTNFSKSASANNFPELLRNAGYYTGFIGKYGVGGSKIPSTSYDYWRAFEGQGVYFYKDKQGQPIHNTDLVCNQALEFLEIRDKDKPFCLQVSFKAPHVQDGSNIHNGYIYSPFYENYFSKIDIPPSPTGDDKYYLAFPAEFRVNSKGIINEARKRWDMRFSTPEKYQESVKSYYRLIAGMDDAIKRLVDNLKEKGLDKNTIIVFSSDNGYSLGDHGLEGKWYAQNESLRTTTIVYDGRSIQNKQVDEHIALNVDLAPTILDYAGVSIPSQMQGKSLKPLVERKKCDWRSEFYYNHLLETEKPNSKTYIPKSEGLVDGVYKYARYFHGDNPDNFFFEEFYNTKIDPFEINNLADNPKNVKIKKVMVEKMIGYRISLK